MATTWSPNQDDQVRSHTLYKNRFWGRHVLEVGRAASASSSGEYERDENIRRGLDLLEALTRAVNSDWWDRDEEPAPNGWRHRSRPMLVNKKPADPYIIRFEVEGAAAEYLALPYRVDGLDRLLTDMLIAAEMFAFADEMQPQLKQKLPTVLSWVWGNLKSLVIGLSLAGLLFWLAPDSNLARWAAGIIAALTLLGAVVSVVVFPFFYPGVRAQRQKFILIVTSMRDTYTTLDGTPTSIPHIRKMVDRATDAGVVWPAPLMALLDDIAERRRAI